MRRARRAFEIADSISPTWLGRSLDPERIVRADTRHSYGEERYHLMGKIEERVFVVYTPRRGAMGIISARKASHREVKQYEDSTRED